MALEGLNTNGAFPVYDTSGTVNLYAKQIAKQQAQRAAEQKAIQDQLSRVKIDGVRDADKPKFYEKYNNWKSLPSRISQEKDPLKKMELQSEFNKQFMELNDYAAKSRAAEKDDDDFSSRALDDRFRNQFTDDAIARVQRNRSLPIDHPDYVSDKSKLARQIDTSKILDSFNKIDDQLLQSAKYDNPKTRRVTSGNKAGTESIYTRKVDPQVQALNYGMMYDTDRSTKAYIQREYKDLFDSMPEDEAKAAAIQDIIAKRPLVRQDAPKIEWDRAPDNFYAHYNYRMNNPLTSGTVNEQVEARKQWIADMKNGVKGSGEKLGAFIDGNPNFSKSSKFVIQWADPKDKSKGYVFDIPAQVKRGGDGEEEVVVARQKYNINPNDPNYEIKINELINNVTGQRMDIGTSTGLKGNTKGTKIKPSNTTSKPKTVARSTIRSLVGEKGYEGYSEKELIDYYTSQGYKITQ